MFDSHAHYFDDRFEDPAEGENADAILKKVLSAYGGEVTHIVNVGTNNENSVIAMEQAARYDGMYCAIGIHPEDCQELTDPEGQIARLRALLGVGKPDPVAYRKEKKIVAIGEIGLDYYERHPVDKALQTWYFERQLVLAEELGLPVIIHDREAHGDCFETALRHPGVRGVFHSFSGSVEMARELWRRGWMISFSGVVTFKNARRVQEVAASVPPEYLLAETDCPYLAPHPHRGERNHSGFMRHTVEMLAALHGMAFSEMERITEENARRLFEI